MEIESETDADGPIQDAPEDENLPPEIEDDAEGSSSDAPVDSRVLEALLFSTHHPLTAGDWQS